MKKLLITVLALSLVMPSVSSQSSTAQPSCGLGPGTCTGGLDIAFNNFDEARYWDALLGNQRLGPTSNFNNGEIGGIGDLDEDGDLDIVYEDDFDNIVYEDYQGNEEFLNVGVEDQITGIADFNDDGDMEVVYNDDASNNLSYTDADENTVVTDIKVEKVGGVGDFDDDGDLDAVYSAYDSDFTFYELGWTDSAGNTGVTGLNAARVGGIGDFNDDGDTEVVYTDNSDNTINYADSDGNNVDTGIVADDVGGLADIDGDGLLEVAYINGNNNLKYRDYNGENTDVGLSQDAYVVGGVNDFGETYNIPYYNNVSTSPSEWSVDTGIDIDVNASDRDIGNVSYVEYRFNRSGSTVKSWTNLANNQSTGSWSTWYADNAYTPTEKGVYTLEIKATDDDGYSNTTTIQQTIYVKGIIPNTEQVADPFFIESGDTNPQTGTGSVQPGDSVGFTGEINASGELGEYQVSFISNSTNPNVAQQESGTKTVTIKFDTTRPELRNYQANVTAEGNQISIADASDLYFKPDGTSVYVSKNLNSQTATIVQYDLTSPWDLSTASQVASFDPPFQNVRGLTIEDNGQVLGITGAGAEHATYDFGTAWDLSTLSQISYTAILDASAPSDNEFNGDGTEYFWTSENGNEVAAYGLSTAYDIGTDSGSRTQTMSLGYTPSSIQFMDSGTRLYIASQNENLVYNYSLSTAYDLSTNSLDNTIDVSNVVSSVNGFSKNSAEDYVSDSSGVYSIDNTGDIASLKRTASINISVEARDNQSGITEARLATNETGTFENKTGVYGSPITYDSVANQWVLANFTWGNSSFTGLVGMRIWVADGNENWNSTDIKVFNVTNLDIEEVATIDVGVGDNTEEQQSLDEDNSQGIGVSDNKQGTSVLARVASQTVNIFNQMLDQADISQAFQDTIQVTNTVDVDRLFQYGFQDDVSIVDNVGVAAVFNRNLDDDISLQDQVLASLVTSQGFSDDVNITGDRAKISFLERTPTENIVIDSATTHVYQPVISQVQTMDILQSVSRTVSFTRNLEDTVDTNGTKVRDSFLERTPTEFITINNTAVEQQGFTEAQLQAINIADTQASVLDAGVNIADNINLVPTADAKFQPIISATASVNVFNTVDVSVDYVRGFLQSLIFSDNVRANANPVVINSTVIVDDLGKDRDVKLEVYVRDADGLSNIQSVQYGSTVNTSITSNTVKLDISDELYQNKSVILSDGQSSTEFNVGFNITDNDYEQVTGYSADLDTQQASKSDTVTNIGSENATFKVSVHGYGGSITGGSINTLLEPGQSTSLTPTLEGDFLVESKQWHTRNDVRQTVYQQSIAETLNVTNKIDDVSWTDINSTSTTVPADFQPCSDCGSKLFSVPSTGYSNKQFWTDTGDAISNQFIQDIEDVILGERNKYWEQYRYSNITGEVVFKDIWLNESIDDNTTYNTPFVQVKDAGEWNNTEIIPETNSCNSIDPKTETFTVGETEFKACSKDLSGTNNPEYFQVQIGSLNDVYDLRLGLGEEVFLPEGVAEGQLCSDDLEGETFQDGELTCFRNEIRQSDEVELPTRNVSVQIVNAVIGAALLITLIILVALILYREELKDAIEEQFPTAFDDFTFDDRR